MLITRYKRAVAPTMRERIKKKAPALWRIDPKPPFQVSINTGQVHPVIEGDQHKSNDHVANQVAEHHLEIIEIASCPRHREHLQK